jgi:hypothetical protein
LELSGPGSPSEAGLDFADDEEEALEYIEVAEIFIKYPHNYSTVRDMLNRAEVLFPTEKAKQMLAFLDSCDQDQQGPSKKYQQDEM